MQVFLHNYLHSDMMACMQSLKTKIGDLGGRVDHVERKMGEFASSYNLLVDSNNEQAVLEDRSRRNNVKICAIPETIQPAQRHQYSTDLIK